jgi:hypothetical protein
LLGSPLDTKPVGGFEPHYFRRLSLQIGAAYVILVLGAFAAVGSQTTPEGCAFNSITCG